MLISYHLAAGASWYLGHQSGVFTYLHLPRYASNLLSG